MEDMDWIYRGTDKSLARPDWKKQLKGRHISSYAEVIAAAETWLEGQPSEFFLSGLQKLDFGRYSLFPSWFLPGRAKDLIIALVVSWLVKKLLAFKEFCRLHTIASYPDAVFVYVYRNPFVSLSVELAPLLLPPRGRIGGGDES